MNGCLNTGRDGLFRQGNNVIEIIDGPELNKCNVTAVTMAWAAVTQGFDKWKNPFGGHYRAWQPEDLVDLYFHEEKNWPHFKQTRDLPLVHKQVDKGPPYQPEFVAQYHQLALREIFGLGADFGFGLTFGSLAGWLSAGTAVIVCLKKPRHYVTCVRYDEDKMLIGFKDPAPVKWLQDTEDADGNKWMTLSDYQDNVQDNYSRAWRI